MNSPNIRELTAISRALLVNGVLTMRAARRCGGQRAEAAGVSKLDQLQSGGSARFKARRAAAEDWLTASSTPTARCPLALTPQGQRQRVELRRSSALCYGASRSKPGAAWARISRYMKQLGAMSRRLELLQPPRPIVLRLNVPRPASCYLDARELRPVHRRRGPAITGDRTQQPQPRRHRLGMVHLAIDDHSRVFPSDR